MTELSNFESTATWLRCCGKEQTPENLSVQIGVHVEEFVEFLGCLEIDGVSATEWAASAIDMLDILARRLKDRGSVAGIPQAMRAQALDALCDQEVTGNGVAYLAKFNKEGADREVLRSNHSKLEAGKPVILPGGKIGKGKFYRPPDLKPFI